MAATTTLTTVFGSLDACVAANNGGQLWTISLGGIFLMALGTLLVVFH